MSSGCILWVMAMRGQTLKRRPGNWESLKSVFLQEWYRTVSSLDEVLCRCRPFPFPNALQIRLAMSFVRRSQCMPSVMIKGSTCATFVEEDVNGFYR